MPEFMSMSKHEQEDYIRRLCREFNDASGERRSVLGTDIYNYCHAKYYRIIKTCGGEREDIFQDIMMYMLTDGGIETFLEKGRAVPFESFFLQSAKGIAYEDANDKVGKMTAYNYGLIREVGDLYGIPICIGNAHKFSRILGKGVAFTTNKVISTIEGYAKEVSIDALHVKGYE